MRSSHERPAWADTPIVGREYLKEASRCMIQTASSFWADHQDQELDIFEQFVAAVTRHANFVVFCYGGYERAFLIRMRKVTKHPQLVDTILNAMVNVLGLLYTQVYFPTYSNGLKDIGRYIGCSWTDP